MQQHSRRELKVRSAKWVEKVTAYLVKTDVTPNQISIMSIVFSALAGLTCYRRAKAIYHFLEKKD